MAARRKIKATNRIQRTSRQPTPTGNIGPWGNTTFAPAIRKKLNTIAADPAAKKGPTKYLLTLVRDMRRELDTAIQPVGGA